MDRQRARAQAESLKQERLLSPCSIAIDLTQVAPPISQIDRDEPRLEEEVEKDGIDSVIAVHDLLASSTSTPAVRSKKIKASATQAIVVEEKTDHEPVLKKGKK